MAAARGVRAREWRCCCCRRLLLLGVVGSRKPRAGWRRAATTKAEAAASSRNGLLRRGAMLLARSVWFVGRVLKGVLSRSMHWLTIHRRGDGLDQLPTAGRSPLASSLETKIARKRASVTSAIALLPYVGYRRAQQHVTTTARQQPSNPVDM